jgi:hypothetical protein
MIRPLVCLLVGVPLLAQADLRSDLAAKYRQLDRIVARKDAAGVSAWIRANTTADFTYTSRDKKSFARTAFEKGLRDQIAITRKVVGARTRVTSAKVSGNTATLVTDSDTTAIVVFDTRPMKLIDTSHTTDTWVRTSGGWRLKRSVQTAGNTQMFQQ